MGSVEMLERQGGGSPAHTQVHASFHPCWVATSKREGKKNYGAISRKLEPFPSFFYLVGAFRGKKRKRNPHLSPVILNTV